jgi:hypothetical protein
VTFYIVTCHMSPVRGANILGAAAFFLAGVGLPAIPRIWFLTACASDSQLKPFVHDDRWIIAIGGLAMLWIFYQSVSRFWKSLWPDTEDLSPNDAE